MKLLLISDVECPALWDHYQPERLAGIDLIVSCGDLKRDYLEFLVTLSGKPLFYVPGNHDKSFVARPPEGCDCLDDTVVSYGGVRFLGLGGCKRYSDGPYQYTEEQMAGRIKKLRRAIKKAGGVDIIVSHAAMTGYGDAEDHAHKGFDCFRQLIDEWQPAYLLHGHVHQNYGSNIPRMVQYHDTTVINAFERYTLELPEDFAAKRPQAERHFNLPWRR